MFCPLSFPLPTRPFPRPAGPLAFPVANVLVWRLVWLQVEMRALDELIASKLPRLHEHFASIDLDISMLATDWYLCLFSVSLPSEVRGVKRERTGWLTGR